MATSIPAVRREQVEQRDNRRCVRCGIPTMSGQWHHRRSRSIRDEHQHCSCNGIYLCSTCHRHVHANPFEARTMGWIVSRYLMPFEMPYFNTADGDWIRPDCEGEFLIVGDPREE